MKHEGSRGLVEVVDVVAAVGEHRVAGEIPLRGLPPVLEQPPLGGDGVGAEVKTAACRGAGEVGLGVAVAQVVERDAFDGVALAAVLAQVIAPSRSHNAT